jgi:hypothetical protein
MGKTAGERTGFIYLWESVSDTYKMDLKPCIKVDPIKKDQNHVAISQCGCHFFTILICLPSLTYFALLISSE